MEKKSIGSFLAALRKTNGMTQQEVADRLNVSNKTISKWERDESYPEITLIPVIAELFGVTSDDILRGERINRSDASADTPDIKIDKQMKRLVSSSVTRFKNISYIAFALCFVGLTSLFTISYAFYRPVLAFGIFLIFIAASTVLELIQLNNTNTSLRDIDIFEGREAMLQPILNAKNNYAFYVIITNIVAVIFSLPIIIIRDANYPTSVITIGSYLGLVPVLAIVAWFIYKISHRLIRKNLIQTEDRLIDAFPYKKMSGMNILQGTAFALQYFVLIVTKGGTAGTPSSLVSIIAVFFPTIFILICMFIYIIKGKDFKERLIFTLVGIRNLFFGIVGLHIVFFIIFRFMGKEFRGFVQLPDIFFISMGMGIVFTIIYEFVKNKSFHKTNG